LQGRKEGIGHALALLGRKAIEGRLAALPDGDRVQADLVVGSPICFGVAIDEQRLAFFARFQPGVVGTEEAGGVGLARLLGFSATLQEKGR
jgi:hypothetical protein